MSDKLIKEIELDHSPIPDGTIRNLLEVQIKRDGEIWRIYKNDDDPFPSNPHAHNIESGLKLDLSTGKLFLGKDDTGKKVSKKDLFYIREQLKDIALPTLLM